MDVAVLGAKFEYKLRFRCVHKIWYSLHVLKGFNDASRSAIIYKNNEPCVSQVTAKRKQGKHLHVRFDVCQEAFGGGQVSPEYCPPTERIETTLSNPLESQKFETVKELSLMNIFFNKTM